MKICYVLEASSAGAGRYVLDLLRGMAGRGHDVHLVYSPIRADAAFRAELRACMGVAAVEIPMRRQLHPSDVAVAVRVARYAAKNGPFDVIHGVSSKGGAIARLVGFVLRSDVYYTPQAFVTMSPRLGRRARLTFGLIERLLAKVTSSIIVVSDVERHHGHRLGIPESKIVYVPNGTGEFAKADRGRVRSNLGIGPDAVVIGFIGRLDDQKAPELLVEAAARLPDNIPEHYFLIVGTGAHEQRLRQMADELRVSDRLHWLGDVRGRDYIAAFDVLLLTSDYEGFPYVFLEALQAGLPIVTTPVGGACEAVEHLRNGLIVPHRDVPTLANSLAYLIGNRDVLEHMASTSRAYASRFTLEKMIDQVEATYQHSPSPTRSHGHSLETIR